MKILSIHKTPIDSPKRTVYLTAELARVAKQHPSDFARRMEAKNIIPMRYKRTYAGAHRPLWGRNAYDAVLAWRAEIDARKAEKAKAAAAKTTPVVTLPDTKVDALRTGATLGQAAHPAPNVAMVPAVMVMRHLTELHEQLSAIHRKLDALSSTFGGVMSFDDEPHVGKSLNGTSSTGQ